MKALLLQLDGKLPNIALMRLSAHLKNRGHQVAFAPATSPALIDRPELWEPEQYDAIYASAIFETTRPLARRLREVYPSAIIGGTGWDERLSLEAIGVYGLQQDYSLYPGFPHSIGFTQRGCRFRCPFCCVPRKEGGIRFEAAIADVWRGDPWPRTLLLLDNDFFGHAFWRARIDEIRAGGFKVCLAHGINARVLTDEQAAALASIDCYDDSFTRRRIYTAWDRRQDEERVFRGLEALVRHGVKPDWIMVYMLIGHEPGETLADLDYRRRRLREFGTRPYPMPYVRTPELVGFQRWVVGAYDKRVPLHQWMAAGCRPEKCGERALPLLEGAV